MLACLKNTMNFNKSGKIIGLAAEVWYENWFLGQGDDLAVD
jgi:hypothetical protein